MAKDKKTGKIIREIIQDEAYYGSGLSHESGAFATVKKLQTSKRKDGSYRVRGLIEEGVISGGDDDYRTTRRFNGVVTKQEIEKRKLRKVM